MVRISIGDAEFKGISFLQNESTDPRIVATRNTLDPHRLYLDSTSSFHQVFTEEHLETFALLEPLFVPTATPAPTLPPKKDGTAIYSTFG